MKIVVEMVQILLGMGSDTYTKCKYMLLASSQNDPTDNAFFEALFKAVDKKRHLCIEMKG